MRRTSPPGSSSVIGAPAGGCPTPVGPPVGAPGCDGDPDESVGERSRELAEGPGADRIVAVTLSGRASTRGGPLTESAGPSDPATLERIRAAAGRWLESTRLDAIRRTRADERVIAPAAAVPVADDAAPALAATPADADFRARDVMFTSLEVMQDALGRHRLADYPPDVLISVRRDACRSLDFHRAGEMIELGRRLAEDALPAILEPDTIDVDRRARRPATRRRSP